MMQIPKGSRTIHHRTTRTKRRAGANFVRVLVGLLWMVPFLVQAQFNYLTNNGALTITRYFGNQAKGRTLAIPGMINSYPVTGIGYAAFAGNLSLTRVTIPEGVTAIGPQAFARCSALAHVSIPNSVTYIAPQAFSGCVMTDFLIPNGVTNISPYAFDSCSALVSITIPNSVTRIGSCAFVRCTSLTNVTVPEGITSLTNGIFLQCAALSSITLPKSIALLSSSVFEGCIGLKSVYFRGDAPQVGASVLTGANQATIYYLPGTKGWGPTFAGRPAVLFNPQVQTGDAHFGVKAGQFGFHVTGTSGLSFVVETTTDLVQPVWTPVSTNTLAAGTAAFSDPQWQNYPARFYRLRTP